MKPRNPVPSHVHLLNLDVQLLYHPIGLVSAVVHWISEEAMHVDTGIVKLELLSEVEITFPHHRNGRTAYHRIAALVSKHEAGKTLLRFLRYSSDAQQALREVMARGMAIH